MKRPSLFTPTPSDFSNLIAIKNTPLYSAASQYYPRIMTDEQFLSIGFTSVFSISLIGNREIFLTEVPVYGTVFSKLGEVIKDTLASKGTPEAFQAFYEITRGQFDLKSGNSKYYLNSAEDVASCLLEIYKNKENIFEITQLRDAYSSLNGVYTRSESYKSMRSYIDSFLKNALNN